MDRTSVDTDGRIVFDVQVDVFLNTKSKVTSLAEVALLQLVFLDFQPSLKDFFSLP